MPSLARVAIGASVMLAGVIINVTSEAQLRRRRASKAIPTKERRGKYVMPKGGLFNYFAMPHYLGEFMEWCGFATLANTKAAWAFAFWTAANLYPRALANKRWYVKSFPNYPRTISSMFPGLP
jgi:3-oxo-5-alpha-steroid 4-dehydrogenase 1